MKWLKVLTKLPKLLNLIKEAREVFEIVQKKVDDPEVLKEIEDVKKALAEFG